MSKQHPRPARPANSNTPRIVQAVNPKSAMDGLNAYPCADDSAKRYRDRREKALKKCLELVNDQKRMQDMIRGIESNGPKRLLYTKGVKLAITKAFGRRYSGVSGLELAKQVLFAAEAHFKDEAAAVATALEAGQVESTPQVGARSHLSVQPA